MTRVLRLCLRLAGLPALLAALVTALLVTSAAPSAGADWTAPPSGTDIDYQLGGAASTPANVGIVARDRLDAPATGLYNICYVNGFQAQRSENRFWRQHRDLLVHKDGALVADEAWGEWLLDVGTRAKRRALAAIVGRWTARCARDGFAAVEYDNLDSYTRSEGVLSRADNLAFAAMLVRRAHRAGLAVGQKNLAGYDGTRIGFDFAVAESCARWQECKRYVRHFADQVLMIEYRQADFARACRRWGASHPIVLRDRALSPGFSGRRWC